MCTLFLTIEDLEPNKKLIVEYLEQHNGGSYLMPLSRHFKDKKGLRGRKTIYNKLRCLKNKGIITIDSDSRRQTYITLSIVKRYESLMAPKKDQTADVEESRVRWIADLVEPLTNRVVREKDRTSYIQWLLMLISLETSELLILSNDAIGGPNKQNYIESSKKLTELKDKVIAFIQTECSSDEVFKLLKNLGWAAGPILQLLEGYIKELENQINKEKRKPLLD